MSNDLTAVGDILLRTFSTENEVLLLEGSTPRSWSQAGPVIGSLRALLAHLRAPAHRARAGERPCALFLDADNGLIAHEASPGDRAAPGPRAVALARRALVLGAAAVILAREPTAGAAVPTADDLELSRLSLVALGAIDVVLHDYVVVTVGGRALSLRGLGLLRGYDGGSPLALPV